MASDAAYDRLERFYRSLIGGRAEQLGILKSSWRLKVARAVYGRFDQDRLLRLARELNLTLDLPDRSFSPSVVYDDAVLVDAPLGSRISEHISFNEGRIYLQSAPSYLVIRHLPIDSADYALDLCGSPGGKAIHCYDRFKRARPVLVNEYSQARRAKLVSVLRTYDADALPALGINAASICRYVANALPLIILDAPCSGEAHLVRNTRQLAQWRPRQSRMLAMRQRAMAIAAVHALMPGGLLLYATCSLSPYENELMIDDVLAKFGTAVELVPWPAGVLSELVHDPELLGTLGHVADQGVDERIAQCAWRFWPAAFGEPFFGVLIRKIEPTYPKRATHPVPISYPSRKSRGAYRTVRLGPAGREYSVPVVWPDLPPLPYLRLGVDR
jgi:16S rRNA C967 or C1407 C5-methylase (RsmB/RsmF family)